MDERRGVHEVRPNNRSLVIDFPDQSEVFESGFAMGQIWEAMRVLSPLIGRTVHKKHLPFILEMAAQHRYRLTEKYEVGFPAAGGEPKMDWWQVTLEPFPSEPSLKVVQ